MLREHKLPAGPRPANQSPTRSGPVEQDSSPQYDFLPQVSFDDLQSSIESASGDFKLTQFPSPTGDGSILDSQGLSNTHAGDKLNLSHNGAMTRVATQPGGTQQPQPARSRAGSIIRSAPNRQSSISSTNSTMSSASEANRITATLRPRRQSQYPPVSNSNIGKGPPRKPVGGGAFDPAGFGNDPSVHRRPSLAANMDQNGLDPSRSIDNGSHTSDNYLNMTTSRAAKVKTVSQPPPSRVAQPNASADNSTLSIDQNRTSGLFPPSPRGSRQGPSTPSAGSKRLSMMPGQHTPHHATGLGARTVSPTDAQRMKRLSIMPTSANNSMVLDPLPPPPPSNDTRPSSRSPSMLPRKTSTPSSQRTTPDPNRKSYSSGFSVGSTTSYNTVRTSTGSLQPRMPPTGTSRLPAPKSLNNLPASSQDEDEDVPPVPAIPKVYESPKDAAAELQFLDKRKSNLVPDESSIHSTSTGSLSGAPVQETVRLQRKNSTRKATQNNNVEQEKNTQTAQPRRNFKSMNLPPLTVGPLSTPTVNKIARLQQDPGSNDRRVGSPPARQMAKTPTTPLTASKTTFFSKNRTDKDLPNLRSKSSAHRSQLSTPLVADSSSPESINGSMMKSSVSPYLSSSVPKENGFEQANFKRSQTGTEIRDTDDVTGSAVIQQKPSGPRAQRQPSKVTSKPPLAPTPKSPVPQSSPEEPPTPSSMTSLRRKLSLSWKRSNSKAASHSQEKSSDPHGTKHDVMPRIPVSATTGNVAPKSGSPSMAPKPSSSYLESKRRKGSGVGLNGVTAHERKRSDASQAVTGHTAKNNGDGAGNRPAVSHSSSVMHKFLRSKPSAASVRQTDVWTADLDRDDLIAEEEMKKLGSRRKETELAAKTLDALRRRATPKERVSPQDAIRIAMLNIYERGEIIDYNDIYFCGTQNAQKVVGDLNTDVPNFGYDDERGDYSIVTGDHLAFRYEIIDVLGKGSFGQVVRCIDHKTGALVAVKIIRNKKRFHQQALVEVNILQKLREWDPHNKHSMVNFTHSFYFRGHLCISTELLDMNLYEFIKANAFRGFSLKMIRRFTKQMLSSLNLLKQHKVIHCDLKPENILVRHPLHTEIKVIDFGSSCFENEKVYTYIQSRFYRSPEVILGVSYGMPIDMWSLGCILAELYTGVPIFPGENEQEQLACIMEVFGPPEKHLIEKSTRKKLFFDSMGKPRLTVSSKGRRRRPSSKTLQQVLKCDDEAFLDFLARCLRWDPDRRMKPEEAIRHEFITGQKTAVPIPRVVNREQSPIKRHNTISTPRPLPEPPAAAASMRVTSSIRPKDASLLGSPVKAGTVLPPGSRRVSGAVVGGPPKRTSTGTGGISGGPLGSNLPRAAGRTVSAKQDLASAGATAAMSRRAGA
ncbi:Dual specificity protein kinase pom1 [Cytospora mali]|uniref:dual-specificity kinase n=1 Tax=Cytospora mali TaxID=578113 RepID=A0A194WD11_CYTMA|nr:Dual specificity protein kinase pom1 [Valsa mali]